MAKERSNYQKKVISRYYENLDAIMLQKLAELVSELYLAETQKKKDRLWQRVEKALENLKIKPAIKEHILKKRDVEILAKNLSEWQSLKKK